MHIDLRKSAKLFTDLHLLLPAALRNFAFSIFGNVAFVQRKIHAVSLIVLASVLFTLGLIIAFYALLPLHPNGKEIAFSILVSFGYWVNFGLIVTGCLAFAAGAIYFFAGFMYPVAVVAYDWAAERLSDGTKRLPPSLSLFPDVELFSLSEDEDAASREERFNQARKNRKPGQYIVCVWFRHPSGLIIGDGKDGVFKRKDPPYQDGWPKESQLIVPTDHLYTAESWAEYEQNILTLCRYMPEYLATIRVDVPNAGEAMAAELKLMQ
jgi:hypothetical protein